METFAHKEIKKSMMIDILELRICLTNMRSFTFTKNKNHSGDFLFDFTEQILLNRKKVVATKVLE